MWYTYQRELEDKAHIIALQNRYKLAIANRDKEVIDHLKEKIQEAKNVEQEKFVRYLLIDGGKTDKQIADISGASIEFIANVKKKLSADNQAAKR